MFRFFGCVFFLFSLGCSCFLSCLGLSVSFRVMRGFASGSLMRGLATMGLATCGMWLAPFWNGQALTLMTTTVQGSVAFGRPRRACFDAKKLCAPACANIGRVVCALLKHSQISLCTKQLHAGRRDGPEVLSPGQGLPRTELQAFLCFRSIPFTPSPLAPP